MFKLFKVSLALTVLTGAMMLSACQARKAKTSYANMISATKTMQICPGFARGATADKIVALTFDDGPSIYTEELLKVLAKHQVPATFFVIGENAQRHPAILTKITEQGHVVANHTYGHRNLVKLEGWRVVSTLVNTNEIIYQHTGRYPRWFRSPYGSCNVATIEAANTVNMTSINWSSATDDYHSHTTSPTKIANEIMAQIKPGTIIDLHDGGGDRHKTVAAVELIIKRLKAAGYKIVPLTELIKQPAYFTAREWKRQLRLAGPKLEPIPLVMPVTD